MNISWTTITKHLLVGDRQYSTTFKPSIKGNLGYFVVWAKVGKDKSKFQGFWQIKKLKL